MSNKMTLLLVEDNPDDEELARLAFAECRLANDIEVARDGQEALDMLFGENGRERLIPSLVLLDLKLPKVDGLEVLRRIREDERTRCLPIVILTTSKEESDLASSYRNGCNSFIRKPVDFSEFTKAIREVGLYWLLLNQPPPPKCSRT